MHPMILQRKFEAQQLRLEITPKREEAIEPKPGSADGQSKRLLNSLLTIIYGYSTAR